MQRAAKIGRRLRFTDWDQSRFTSNSVVEKNHYREGCHRSPRWSRAGHLAIEYRWAEGKYL
jgi:hypothetical protein